MGLKYFQRSLTAAVKRFLTTPEYLSLSVYIKFVDGMLIYRWMSMTEVVEALVEDVAP